MNRKWLPVVYAVLGIVIGILLTLNYQKIFPSRTLKVSGHGWDKLQLVLQSVQDNYVDEVNYSEASEAAIEALLAKLDPHSVYMPPVVLEKSNEELSAGFDGIGIQFNVPNDTAIVIEVIPGGPSEKIGMQPGDRLLMVDTVGIAGVQYPQDSMVRRMRGPAGTKVTVTVKRGEDTIPFEITRGRIPMHSVDAAFMVDDTTGYIRLSKFSRSTYAEVAKAGIQLQGEGMGRLILDIRGNSGGYFDQALMLSDLFLKENAPIVYTEGLHRDRESFNATGKGIFTDLPLTVLIDGGSASSSEIFAGAMQDNGRAVIVGRRSFGKGLVQEPIQFSDGSGIRLTVARFYTPSGRCLQKPYSEDYELEVYKRYDEGEMVVADSMKVDSGGIIPDVFVPMDTSRVTQFYLSCIRKATTMRFASAWFDAHHDDINWIEDYDVLNRFLDMAGLEKKFLAFARERDGLVPAPGEWEETRPYLMTQVRALVGRYSKLGDNAYYHLFFPEDNVIQCAIGL